MAKWKCDECGDVTEEEKRLLPDAWDRPTPILGWGCTKAGCKGRRPLLPYEPLALEAKAIFSRIGLNDYLDALKKTLETTRGKKFSLKIIINELT